MTTAAPTGSRAPLPRPSAAAASPDGGGCGGCGASRRSFLARGAVLGVAGAASAGLTGCTDTIRSRNEAPSTHVGGTPTPTIPAAELPVGTSARIEVAGRTLLLRREASDVVHAYSAACTHQGCTVAPASEDGQDVFACPCHGSHFDVETGVPFGGPAQKPLNRFTATVDGDWVLVKL